VLKCCSSKLISVVIVSTASMLFSKIKYEDKNGRIVEKFSTGHFVVNCNDGLLLITDYDGKVALGDILGDPYNDK